MAHRSKARLGGLGFLYKVGENLAGKSMGVGDQRCSAYYQWFCHRRCAVLLGRFDGWTFSHCLIVGSLRCIFQTL